MQTKFNFNFDIFKDALIKETSNDCLSFENIIKWISNKNFTSYDEETDYKFLPTNGLDNLSKAFISYWEQFQIQEIGLTGKENYYISFNRKFAKALFNHAQKEIKKNILEKYFLSS